MRTVLARARWVAGPLVLALVVAAAGCGADDDERSADASSAQIVVTTSILGDVVQNLVGDDVEVAVLMEPGTDPHDFAPSARQAAAMRSADVMVVNGLGLEAGLRDTIEAAERDGTTVLRATDSVELIDSDPHIFTDPARIAEVAAALGDALAEQVDALDTGTFQARVDAYVAELESLDREVDDILAVVPDDRRILVTNHEVFAYFADRYDFEVLGSVIPGGSTLAEPSAADLAALADAIEDAGVPAIFTEASSPSRLSEALAAEGSDVEVVELYTESLGEAGSDGDSYVHMTRTNARRIADALDHPVSDEG